MGGVKIYSSLVFQQVEREVEGRRRREEEGRRRREEEEGRRREEEGRLRRELDEELERLRRDHSTLLSRVWRLVGVAGGGVSGSMQWQTLQDVLR